MTQRAADPPASAPIGADTNASAEQDGVIQRVRVAAYAWIERNGAVLLVRIAPTEAGAGQWTLPGGGLDFGEEPEHGVLRELREETGLTGTVGALLGVRSAVLEHARTKSGHRIQSVGVLYRVDPDAGELVMEVDGSSDLAAWVPFDELDDLPLLPLGRWARTLAGR